MDRARQSGAFRFPEEREQGHHHQQRLQSFAQQDGEGADEEGGCIACAALDRLLGLHQQAVDRVGLRRERRNGRPRGQRAAIGAHRRLEALAQGRITQVQLRFDRFHAIEVGRQRQLRRLAGGAVAVRLEARGDAAAREREALGTFGHRTCRMRTQVAEHGTRAIQAQCWRQLRRASPREVTEAGHQARRRAAGGKRLRTGGRFGGVGQRAGVIRQRPAVGFRQLRRIRGHRRARHALGDHLVERQGAAFVGTRLVGEIDRRRRQLCAGNAIAASARAVAAGALCAVQARRMRKIRRLRRRGGNGIRLQQGIGQRMRLLRDGGRRSLRLDQSPQLVRAGQQRAGCRHRRQVGDVAPRRARKFLHLGVFRCAGHRAIRDRASVVGREVIQHLPGLRHGRGDVGGARAGGERQQRRKQRHVADANR